MNADVWEDGAAYESYVGRWSRQVAPHFTRWLSLADGSAWLDFGCGSGALTQAILSENAPRLVVGCDKSADYIRHARTRISDPRAQFAVGTIGDLPHVAGGFDACVSGLVLNFLPSPGDGLIALAKIVRQGGIVAAYVWDYEEGMELMRIFWDEAIALDPSAGSLDERARFPQCRPDPLRQLFAGAGLENVDVRAIDVPTVFRDFDDYWQPFLGGQGPAPGHLMRLSPERRNELRTVIQARLPTDAAGRIPLTARAWAVRGVVV
jgi:SAM-dependent methyltransferase